MEPWFPEDERAYSETAPVSLKSIQMPDKMKLHYE